MSRCLGDRVAALADGAMTPAETERALAHVAACSRCRADLQAQREMRMLLRGLGAPQVPGDVVASVSRIPVRPPGAPTPGLVPPPPLGGVGPAAGVVESGRPLSLVPRRPGPIVASVAAVTVSAGLSMLAAAPQAAVSVPRVAPDTATFVAEHRAAAGSATLVAPALRATEIAAPSGAPAGTAPARSFAATASATSVLAAALAPSSTMATAWTGRTTGRQPALRAVSHAFPDQVTAEAGLAVAGAAAPADVPGDRGPSAAPSR